MEARVGIEPTNRGFAVHGITTLLPSLISVIPQSYVIPAKAGIHRKKLSNPNVLVLKTNSIYVFELLDSRFHGNDITPYHLTH